MPGNTVNVPAVTPAPQPTISTERGCGCTSAGRSPSIRCNRMSCGSLDASILPLMWKLRTPVALSFVTATELFMPSPT